MAQDEVGRTLLHHACNEDSRSAVIPLLLAHPEIDVNKTTGSGFCPFHYACGGFPSCVREMLKDSMVKVSKPNNTGWTPLWCAAANGHLDVIKLWIASGRELDFGKPGDKRTDAIGAGKKEEEWRDEAGKKRKAEVVTLLERFKSDAAQTRHSIRAELGFVDDLAAEVFALVVFVSNGLLKIDDSTPSPAARFFNIARQLPLELQMVLCYHVVGSAKENIPGKDSEVAFKELARKLW